MSIADAASAPARAQPLSTSRVSVPGFFRSQLPPPHLSHPMHSDDTLSLLHRLRTVPRAQLEDEIMGKVFAMRQSRLFDHANALEVRTSRSFAFPSLRRVSTHHGALCVVAVVSGV